MGSTVNTVRPTFHLASTGCANSFEIHLSESEDTDVENPIWSSGALSSNINIYPEDAIGLLPGQNYKWKMRLNPDGEPGPWSNIFDFSISDYSLDEPSGNNINNVNPTFYFTVPLDIASYELRISNFDDQMVDIGNMFNQNITGSPFQLPSDLSVGLMPGEYYYWKLIFYDSNDNILGDMDYYNRRNQFRIKAIGLSSPSNNSTVSTMTPSFIWNGVTGIPNYELSISQSDDPQVEDPFFTESVSGTFYQYPQFAEIQLESGQIYYWKVIPIDENDNRGEPNQIWKFTIMNSNESDLNTDFSFGESESDSNNNSDDDNGSSWDSDDNSDNEADFSWNDDSEEEGCTDLSACNYSSTAQIDDGSCEYTYDCNGVCGGNKVLDDCGICGGYNSPNTGNCDCAGIPDGDAEEDCAGVCNGDAEIDICGTCNGSVTNPDYCQGCTDSEACNYDSNVQIDDGSCEYITDCLGVCGGSAVIDDCGICNGDNVDMDCAGICNGDAEEDCAGVCNGDAEIDICGTCNGTATDESQCSGCTDSEACNYSPDAGIDDGSCEYIVDCFGTCGGSAVIDDCEICNGNNESMDCAGICNGDAEEDCAGVCNGNAQEDVCGICNGTATDESQCSGCTDSEACNYDANAGIDDGSCEYTMDCAGVCGGSAVIDDCEICDGGNQNMDCAGVCGGESILDCAGVCGGVSVLDCMGVCGGDALEDVCGICNGNANQLSDCEDEEDFYQTSVVSSSTSYASDLNLAVSTKPEFSVSNGQQNSLKDIIVSLLAVVTDANEYIIYFSYNQNMESNFNSISLTNNQVQATLDGSDLEWDSTIYIQVVAQKDGDLVGELSSIQVVNLPKKPGSEDQVAFSIILDEGSIEPSFEVINPVTNATSYNLDVSTNIEMTEIINSSSIFENLLNSYPNSAPVLSFGNTYYFQVNSFDEEGPHGLPSSVISLFIPNVVPPNLNDEFSWESTIPESNKYLFQISTTDDFSSIVFESNVDGLSYSFSYESLDPGTVYYWKVQGLDVNDNLFGDSSNIRFFETEGSKS